MASSPSAAAVVGMGSGGVRRNPTLICTPIMADSVDKMAILMAEAKSVGADLVEIRLDSLKDFNHNSDIKTLILHSPLPTLFTYRCLTYLPPFSFPFLFSIFLFIFLIIGVGQCGKVVSITVMKNRDWMRFD